MVIRIFDPDRRVFDALPDPAYSKGVVTIQTGAKSISVRVESIETDGKTTTIRTREEQ